MKDKLRMFKRIAIIFAALLLTMSIITTLVGCKEKEEQYSKDLWEDYMLEMKYVDNFKIMQFADIQARTAEACNNAFIDIKTHVEKEKPNLIVLTGDNIEDPKNEDAFNALVSNMESLNTPWAPVFGNHDANGVLTKDFMAEKFIAAENCLFYKGAQGVDGVGNYVINLTAKNNKIVYSLFLIDSNMYDGNGGYDWIHENQIDWYTSAVSRLKAINKKKVVPSLAFFHIPLQEFIDAKVSYESGESIGEWAIFNEKICPGTINSGFFDKVKELGSTKAIICGHEHINTCNIEYQGINLVYGLKSSRNSYFDSTLLGTTIITLTKKVKIYNSFFE